MYGRGRGWGFRAGDGDGDGGGGGGGGNSDDDLARAARAGDRAAFDRLVARHRPWVVRWVRSVVGDPDLAEDVAQETFCRLHRHLGDYREQGRFVAWVRRIALNLARNALRDRQSALARAERIAAAAETADVPPARAAPRAPPHSDPAAVLESRLLRDEVRAALAGLGPDHQRALLLHYFAGLSVDEIAAATDCPPGTVKSRLHHARRHVRRALLEETAEDDADRPRQQE